MMIPPRWPPEFNFGHVFQASTTVMTVIVGGVIAWFVFVGDQNAKSGRLEP